jgi:hypothetical protein
MAAESQKFNSWETINVWSGQVVSYSEIPHYAYTYRYILTYPPFFQFPILFHSHPSIPLQDSLITNLVSRFRYSALVILNLDPRIFNPGYLKKAHDFFKISNLLITLRDYVHDINRDSKS